MRIKKIGWPMWLGECVCEFDVTVGVKMNFNRLFRVAFYRSQRFFLYFNPFLFHSSFSRSLYLCLHYYFLIFFFLLFTTLNFVPLDFLRLFKNRIHLNSVYFRFQIVQHNSQTCDISNYTHTHPM